MRFMVIIKANEDSEAGVMPPTEVLEQMGAYNQRLMDAGVLLAGEGLHPTSRAVRVHFHGDERTVVDGPFTETKELIAGFWILQCRDWDEVLEWVKRCPYQAETPIEVRQVFEAEDFGEEFTPELREAEQQMRDELERRA